MPRRKTRETGTLSVIEYSDRPGRRVTYSVPVGRTRVTRSTTAVSNYHRNIAAITAALGLIRPCPVYRTRYRVTCDVASRWTVHGRTHDTHVKSKQKKKTVIDVLDSSGGRRARGLRWLSTDDRSSSVSISAYVPYTGYVFAYRVRRCSYIFFDLHRRSGRTYFRYTHTRTGSFAERFRK